MTFVDFQGSHEVMNKIDEVPEVVVTHTSGRVEQEDEIGHAFTVCKRNTIFWAIVGILLIGALEKNFSEILIWIQKHFYSRKFIW